MGPEGKGVWGFRTSPGKSQVVIGYLRIFLYSPLEKQLEPTGPLGTNWFSREVCTAFCETR